MQEHSASTSSTIDMNESTQICDNNEEEENEIINLQNDRDKSLLELVKPFEGVLDPDLLQSITCGIEDFMHHSIIQTEKVSSETKNSSSQEDQKLTDEEFVNYIPSEEEAKALLEKISQLQNEGTKVVTIDEASKENLEDLDEDLIRLQQAKKQQINALISPLQSLIDPEMLSAIQQSLSFISTQETLEENVSKTSKVIQHEHDQEDSKDETDDIGHMEDMIKIEMQKQQNIKEIMGPLKDVIPPELLETLNVSLKEMAKSESLTIGNV